MMEKFTAISQMIKKLRQAAEIPDATILRDLIRLEKWDNNNLIPFKKRKIKSSSPGEEKHKALVKAGE